MTASAATEKENTDKVFIKKAMDDVLRDAHQMGEVITPVVLVDTFALQAFLLQCCEVAPLYDIVQISVQISGNRVCVDPQDMPDTLTKQGVLAQIPRCGVLRHARGYYMVEAMKSLLSAGLVRELPIRSPDGRRFGFLTAYAFTEEALRKGLALRVARELEGKHAA